jgi:hypothetical protein
MKIIKLEVMNKAVIEAKDLNKHPIRYATQYLGKLLAQLSKPKLVEEITFSVKQEILLITCKTDEDYQVLKQCESLLDKDFIAKLGLKAFLFQYDKYYLVLKIINNFAKQGLTEITFESVFNEVNQYTPARTAQAVKNVLASFANDLSKNSWQQSTYNKELLAARGIGPLVKRLKSGNYELLLKLNSKKPDPKKKSKGK